MRTTLLDVAKRVGVSRATASHVLGNKSGGNVRISDPTRDRILQAARDLNYVVDARARNLRQKKSPIVGVLVSHLDTAVRTAFLHSMAGALVKTRREALLGIHLGEPELVKHHIDMFRAYRTQAVFILGRQDSVEDTITDLIRQYVGECGPGIAIGANFRQRSFPSVTIDSYWACQQILSLMRDDGRRRLLLAAMRHSGSERLAEMFEAAAGTVSGIGAETLLLPMTDRVEFGRQAAARILSRCGSERWGVLTSVDTEAVELARALAPLGVSIPDHIAIVGYGNHDFTRYSQPTITSVDSIHATPEIAEQVMMLLEQIGGGNGIEPQEYLVRPKLIVRESFVTPLVGWAVRGE